MWGVSLDAVDLSEASKESTISINTGMCKCTCGDDGGFN
jgi:hypothetical protein